MLNMELNYTIKEKNDTIVLNFDVKQLQELPIKVAMKTLEIIEKNNKINDRYVEFDKNTQKFIEENHDKYVKESSLETKSFKELSNFYFDSLSGPLYVYGTRVKEIVSIIYEKENLCNHIPDIKIPKIIYKFSVNPENNLQEVLEVKNIQELISNFGKATTLHSLILFKDHMNYEYKIKNKTYNEPYGISKKIFSSCYDEELQIHPRLKTFEGQDYILESLFNNQTKKINNPEEIFKLVLMKESLRESIEINNKPKINKRNKF